MMDTEEYTLMDTEQSLDGRIFSITIAHVWMNHTEGTMSLGEPMTYFVHESFNEDFRRDKNSFDKLTSTWFDLKVRNLPYVELPFHKIMEKIARRVVDNGCTLVSHSIDRDLEFMWKSDQFYNAIDNSPRFFNMHPLSHPGECTRNYNWKKAIFIYDPYDTTVAMGNSTILDDYKKVGINLMIPEERRKGRQGKYAWTCSS
jgi:hypothetical protein